MYKKNQYVVIELNMDQYHVNNLSRSLNLSYLYFVNKVNIVLINGISRKTYNIYFNII